ncbi:hypothetical protein BZA77DRAFT_362400 [Pyronema omphalodes]|nr:hypothetical protein BZA77DRAFT_362400 [Pyronema omphalodes]
MSKVPDKKVVKPGGGGCGRSSNCCCVVSAASTKQKKPVKTTKPAKSITPADANTSSKSNTSSKPNTSLKSNTPSKLTTPAKPHQKPESSAKTTDTTTLTTTSKKRKRTRKPRSNKPNSNSSIANQLPLPPSTPKRVPPVITRVQEETENPWPSSPPIRRLTNHIQEGNIFTSSPPIKRVGAHVLGGCIIPSSPPSIFPSSPPPRVPTKGKMHPRSGQRKMFKKPRLEYLNSDALEPPVVAATDVTVAEKEEPVVEGEMGLDPLEKDAQDEEEVVLPPPPQPSKHATPGKMSSNPSDWADLHLITLTDPNGDAESSYLLSDEILEPPSLD